MPTMKPHRAPVIARSPAGPTLSNRESRGRLALMVMKLLARWALSTAEQSAALGISADSRTTLARYRKGEPFADNRDLLDRAGHLLGIHKSLRIMFPHDPDLAYRWMTQPNLRLGTRPVDIVIDHGFEGLLSVRRYLDFERGR